MLLELKEIRKSFGGIEVLHGVSLDLHAGQALGLVGENGSGKSTTMNILGGVLRASSGSMTLDGKTYAPQSPRDATRAGIAFIHQELNLFDNLSIEENLFIGGFPRRLPLLPLIHRRHIRQRALEVLDMLDVRHSPQTLVNRLSPGQRQMVEIAKALIAKARIIILDEPTTSLTSKEIKRLFEIIQRLKTQNISMIYISHILDDVLGLCDEIAILRDGNRVGGGEAASFDHDNLVELMVGRTIDQLYPERTHRIGNTPVLKVTNLRKTCVLKDISFQVMEGEVVGISGLMGAGRTELARVLFGLDAFQSGTVEIDRTSIKQATPRRSLDCGMAFLTEDRRGEGLMMQAPIGQNIALASLPRYASAPSGWIDDRRLNSDTTAQSQRVHIRSSDLRNLAVDHLSGGNQQKVVLAKWLLRKPRLFVLDEPTRGIDIGAKHEIYKLMNELVADGAGVLVISSEIEELIGICDRILVMSRGEIKGCFERGQFDSQQIMHAAMWTRTEESA